VPAALEIARQIAEGLQAAHAAGIVHRDLKPGNVMLLPDGTVRILDFGLAKARDQSLSEIGVRFGTVSYMSPEQIRAEDVDGRADLWALGVVLYEMLTGRKPFVGFEEVSIAHAILHDEPALLSTHRDDLPARLERVVLRLLQKNPAGRYATAAELLSDLAGTGKTTNGMLPHESVEALNNPVSTHTRGSVTAPAQVRPAARLRQLLYGVGALAVLFTAMLVWGWMHPAPAKQVARYSYVFDSADAIIQPIGMFWGRLAMSRDGSRLAYIGGPRAQILVRQRNQLHATVIPGTEGAENPFFSPDGQQVGFVTDGKLQIASLNGDPLITVTDSGAGTAGASWADDGFIYMDGRNDDPLLRVEATAGRMAKPVTVFNTAAGEVDHSWPDVLPNGKGVLITIGVRDAIRSIGVVDLSSGKHHVILNNAVYARYSRSGHLLYVTPDRTLMVVPFDQNAMKITGEPTVLDHGLRLSPSSTVDLAVSDNGTLLYTRGSGAGKQELVWVTRDGKAQPVDPDWQGTFTEPSLAPDGRRLAVTLLPNVGYDSVARTSNIWIKRLDRGPGIKLTLDRTTSSSASWTPDSRSVTFTSNRTGSFDLWTTRADGSTQAAVQIHEKRGVFTPRWSPEGKWLVFRTDFFQTGAGDILGIRPGVDTVAVSLVATRFSEVAPAISPDGRWLAYTSNESGRYEVYVVPFPNTAAAKWAVSTRGGTEPLWSHNGKELFYRDVEGNLVAVKVKSTPTFSLGRSATLFPAANYFSFERVAQYAVAPDDRRFLMIRRVPGGVPDELIVVDNWFEELKAKQRK
jgi:serine/threonine-protein kinase